MKKLFAVPTYNGQLTAHFGHCERFAILETENDIVIEEKYVDPPVHQPGIYPKFLADIGVKIIIAGGMGQKALDLFAQNNIEVRMGVNSEHPRKLVEQYIEGELQTGNNMCDH